MACVIVVILIAKQPRTYLVDFYRIMAYGNPRLAEPEEFARDRWCSCCFTLFPSYLMHSDELRMCAGCALRVELDRERDHYKLQAAQASGRRYLDRPVGALGPERAAQPGRSRDADGPVRRKGSAALRAGGQAGLRD